MKSSLSWRALTQSGTAHPRPYRLPPTITQLLSAPSLKPSDASTSRSSSPASTASTSSADSASGSREKPGDSDRDIDGKDASPSSSSVPISVTGFLKSIRRQKRVSFAVVSDGSNARGLQAVFEDAGMVKELTNGSSVRLTGILTQSPGPGQDRELRVETCEVLGGCDPETYPIQKQTLTPEYLRDNAHLRARTDSIGAMIRVRNVLKRRVEAYFEDTQGFNYTHTPILTSNDAEGAGETFRIAPMAPSPSESAPPSESPQSTLNETQAQPAQPEPEQPEEFFGRPAHLTVSSQLHLEALSHALSRVYTLSPCFRAEPSQTNRHLAEFWMLEAEWVDAFPARTPDENGLNGLAGLTAFVEDTLKTVLRPVLLTSDMDVMWRSTSTSSSQSTQSAKRQAVIEAISSPASWPRITYTEAVKLLRSRHFSSTSETSKSRPPSTFQFEPAWGKALQSEHERYLATELYNSPVFITDYPASLKPFYMRLNSRSDVVREDGQDGQEELGGEEGETVACFDLIVPHLGELVGGSVREERLDLLTKKMQEMGMGSGGGEDGSGLEGQEGVGAEYKWYMDLRKYGGAPHVGFGMGFERLVAWVSGIENVRECVPMPRWAGRMVL